MERKFSITKKFVDEHCELPSKENNENLYSWILFQKSKYKTNALKEYQQQKLEEIGVKLNTRKEQAFIDNYELLKEFIAENKRLPDTNDKYKNFGLGVWCSRIREDYKKGLLNHEQIAKLLQVKFDLRSTNEIRAEQIWQQNYTELMNFVAEHNRLPKVRENQKLQKWFAKQRNLCSEELLSEDKMLKIRSLL